MRIFFLISILTLVSYALSAVTPDEKVTVRRGDSWATIAAKYDIDPELIKEFNGGLPECYVGMSVTIPGNLIEEAIEIQKKKREQFISETIQNEFERAERLANTGQLKEAKKVLDNVIELRPSYDAYFMRGKIEYNREKWGSAMSDFSKVMNDGKCPSEIRSDANVLYSQASSNKSIADAEKAQMIGNLVGMAAMVAGQVTNAIAMDKANKGSRKVSTSVTAPSRNYYESFSSKRSSSPSHVASRSTGSSKGRSSRAYSTNHSHTPSRTSSVSSSNGVARGYKSTKYASRGSDVNSGIRSRKTYTSQSSRSITNKNTSTEYAQRESASETMARIQASADKYLSPENFVANYMSGRATLPSSAELGLTGSDAYAYDLQRNLQFQSQEMDRQSAIMTHQLVQQGAAQAQQEISDFYSKYGRMPTEAEIDMIYNKYVGGYVASYKEYVDETISVNKELKLGEISHKTSNGKSVEESSGSTTGVETTVKTTEKNTTDIEGKNNKEKKDNKEENDFKGSYKQYRTGIYDYATKHQLYTGKVYLGSGGYSVEINGSFHKAKKTSKPGFSHSILIGSKEYYLNIPLNL